MLSEHFDAWQLLAVYEVIKYEREHGEYSLNNSNVLERIEDKFFMAAYNKLGLKPISKCSIEELEKELERRKTSNN